MPGAREKRRTRALSEGDAGVRVEGHHDARKPPARRFLNNSSNDRLMPQVDAVESADGKARWAPQAHHFFNVFDCSHLL